MEQENKLIEQQELLESIKETYSPNAASVKLFCVLCLIMVAIIVGDVLTGGCFSDWIFGAAFILLLTLAEYCKYKFSKAIEPVEDVHELLAHYKRYELQSSFIYSLLFVGFLAHIFYDKHGGSSAFAIGMAVVVVLLVVCWFAGGLTDKNIKWLRKLVAQEENKNGAKP